ncbi:hypothetical protein PVK06_044176 [Gossypium arboreum]|uniref:Gag-pol polyprotein n=1 Tax=Gossypium arboreum TaxID=29729 RepID=A0ABR0MQF4_GOSAR|nr:hypothetical protein PVK06_044176 [Gossypium arboreum]
MKFETLRIEECFNVKLVRKVFRSLLEQFAIKVMDIKKTKDIDTIRIDELIDLLQTFEISIDKTRKNKSKAKKNIELQIASPIAIEDMAFKKLTRKSKKFDGN